MSNAQIFYATGKELTNKELEAMAASFRRFDINVKDLTERQTEKLKAGNLTKPVMKKLSNRLPEEEVQVFAEMYQQGEYEYERSAIFTEIAENKYGSKEPFQRTQHEFLCFATLAKNGQEYVLEGRFESVHKAEVLSAVQEGKITFEECDELGHFDKYPEAHSFFPAGRTKADLCVIRTGAGGHIHVRRSRISLKFRNFRRACRCGRVNAQPSHR